MTDNLYEIFYMCSSDILDTFNISIWPRQFNCKSTLQSWDHHFVIGCDNHRNFDFFRNIHREAQYSWSIISNLWPSALNHWELSFQLFLWMQLYHWSVIHAYDYPTLLPCQDLPATYFCNKILDLAATNTSTKLQQQ